MDTKTAYTRTFMEMLLQQTIHDESMKSSTTTPGGRMSERAIRLVR
jgi:hypothetical protein